MKLALLCMSAVCQTSLQECRIAHRLPAEDATAVWLFGTVAGMTHKDQSICQNTIGKRWVQTKATRQQHVDVMGQDSKHCLHICPSFNAAVSVLHSIGGLEHNVKQNCSAVHDLQMNFSTDCQLLGRCLCCHCDAHDTWRLTGMRRNGECGGMEIHSIEQCGKARPLTAYQSWLSCAYQLSATPYSRNAIKLIAAAGTGGCCLGSVGHCRWNDLQFPMQLTLKDCAHQIHARHNTSFITQKPLSHYT